MPKIMLPTEYARLTRASGIGTTARRLQDVDVLAAALFPISSLDIQYGFDDFEEDTISSTRWNLHTDASATAFAWDAVKQNAGVIKGVTGTADNENVAFSGDAIFVPDALPGIEFIWYTDGTLTDLRMECGFADALSDYTLPAVTDVDTPAIGNGATDVAVLHIDTDQTLATMALVGANAGTVAKTNIATFTPVTNTMYVFRIQVNGASSISASILTKPIDSTLPFHVPAGLNEEYTVSTGPVATINLRPYFLFGNRAGSNSKDVYVDRVNYWQVRGFDLN